MYSHVSYVGMTIFELAIFDMGLCLNEFDILLSLNHSPMILYELLPEDWICIAHLSLR